MNEGDKAPTFKELTAAKGKTVVLYFYPRDNTPGCTTEACDFRDNLARLSDLAVAHLHRGAFAPTRNPDTNRELLCPLRLHRDAALHGGASSATINRKEGS